jgi:uncharacterized protein (TIGR00369 family)
MSQRIKIRNPFDPAKNLCFGCGPFNPAGLKLTFEEDEEKLYATWHPLSQYQGYFNVLHGGIVATLLDETGAWCINVKAGTAGVTASMTIKYLRPVYISKGPVSIEASLVKVETKNAMLLCSLFDGDGNKCAEAELDYFIYPENIASSRYNYPGKEAFYF